MKKCSVLIFVVLLWVSALSILADRQVTVRNIDTGESFEMTVPEGFHMHHINQDWLDSIPYLMEHARMGEPWAYRAIADCYRLGKGGLPVSLFNAVGYYELSGRKSDEWINMIEKENHEDPMAVVKKMIDYSDEKDFDSIEECISILNRSDYHDADILLDFIDRNRNNESMEAKEILQFLKEEGSNPDELMFISIGLSLFNCTDAKLLKESPSALSVFMEKLPFFYSYEGVDIYSSTISITEDSFDESDDSILTTRREAIEFLLKADQHACLTNTGAKVLYEYCTEDPNSSWVNISEEDLNRIKSLWQKS